MKTMSQKSYFIIALLVLAIGIIIAVVYTKDRQINADSVTPSEGVLPDTTFDSTFEPVTEDSGDSQNDMYGDIFAPQE